MLGREWGSAENILPAWCNARIYIFDKVWERLPRASNQSKTLFVILKKWPIKLAIGPLCLKPIPTITLPGPDTPAASMIDEIIYNSEGPREGNKYAIEDIFGFKPIGKNPPDIGLYLSQQHMFIIVAKIVKVVPEALLSPDPELCREKPSPGRGLSRLKSLVMRSKNTVGGVTKKRSGSGEGTFYRTGPDGEIVELTATCRPGAFPVWGTWG